MTEKRYFKYKPLVHGYVGTFVAFPAKIVVSNTITDKTITHHSDYTVDLFEEDENFEECTEAEFIEVYHEVNNFLTIKFHDQTNPRENWFIKNEQLNQDDYEK